MIFTTGVIVPSHEQLKKAFLPFRATKMAVKSAADLPKNFSLPDTDIHNQGAFAECLACAWAAVTADAYQKEFGQAKKMAPSYSYGKRVKQTYRGEGMMLDTGIQDCITYGIPFWDDMPFYGDYPTCAAKITPGLDAKAAPQKALSAVNLLPDHVFWGYGNQLSDTEINIIKTWLYTTRLSIIFVMDVYEQSFQMNDGKGNIKIADIYNEKPLGPHGMRLYGWREDGYWKVQNSWGANWGAKGICYVPFANITSQHFIGITDYIAPVVPPVIPPDPPVEPDKPDPPPVDPPKPPVVIPEFKGFTWKYDAKKKKLTIHITDKKGYDCTIKPDGKKTKSLGFSISKLVAPFTFTVYGKDKSKTVVKV